MRRRELLTAAGFLVSSGCLGQSVSGKWTDEYVSDIEFTVGVTDGSADVEAPPNVRFRPDSNQIVVSGALWVGSGSCNKAKLATVSYDRSNETLGVVVKAGENDGLLRDIPFLPVGCTADMSADAYELVVTFRESVAKTVIATERRHGEATKTTATKPVD